jgi:hypothetical protein
LPFTTCQIYQLQLARNLRILRLAVLLKDGESENAMRAAGRVVHIVRRHYFVFKASVEVLKGVLSIHAFKDVHVFNRHFVG